MPTRLAAPLAALLIALAATPPAPAAAEDARPAKELFGHVSGAADLPPNPYGFYTRGCLSGALELPADGPYHQVMRPSRNRAWGHPQLIDYLEKLTERAARATGWPGLLIGDLAQPRGGPMLTGHASHQVGLDADIWLMPAPPRKLSVAERESISAASMIGAKEEVPKGNWKVDPTIWSGGQVELIKAAASDPRVARIFVHPAIKKALCEAAGGDRGWLSRVRPWYGHHYHMHVRLNCPKGAVGCKNQDGPPAGDGCGSALDYWFSKAPYAPPKKPAKPRPPMTMASLPAACKQVLEAK
ncbi:MAG: penicillin-insensitive murein endopeptidase [Rhodobiaceae bacterium]|nr:penicillin-insensitive murein endopeptidase [Rhodobiaceae bacterium]